MNARIAIDDRDACPDCYRPKNAGGVHNYGCSVDSCRSCPLCSSIHDEGEDVHRDRLGLFCTQDLALARTIELSPGWSKARCEAHVQSLVDDIRKSYDVVMWLKSSELHRQALRAALLARGVW